MRRPLILLLFAFSCKSLTETEKLHQTLTGKWMIIAPDHRLQEGVQQVIYSRIQDSIVELKGLKLVSLDDNGVFHQVDSIGRVGRWGLTPDNILFIENGGMGFDNFTARFTEYNDGTLRLKEFIEVEGETIELVWKLRKVNGSAVSKLFAADKNEWRKKPLRPETEKQIKQRLSAMLQYYADYSTLVNKESSFFVIPRVVLPFQYYQHAMSMKPFDENSFFAGLFFDKDQAKQAWQYLKLMFSALRDKYPREENYVIEYAGFMEKMAKRIVED